jgi:methyltransferase (TIGR00027 family)
MQQNTGIIEPDNTAVRTSLWRALHMQVDAEPHILEDETGLKLIAPSDGWQERPDMKFTKRIRASIVARSRFIEDLMIEQSKKGINQYIILGSGLDTFAQRRPDIAANLQIYEIDQSNTLAWKERRLIELGFGIPDHLHFVPVNFESSSWWQELSKTNFDFKKPAVVACTGVSLYLTSEAINNTLDKIALLAAGSKLAMTFYLPVELLDDEDKPMQKIAEHGALNAGTPMISFFTPDEIGSLAKAAGFTDVNTITTKDMEQLYFANRPDGLSPASGEIFLLATV